MNGQSKIRKEMIDMKNTITNAKKELITLLKENGGFRDIFEKYLWNCFVASEDLVGSNLYVIYYDYKKNTFTQYEFTNSSEWIPNDDLIELVRMDNGIWDVLFMEYNTIKEMIEKDGDTMAYGFGDWVEEEIKGTYIENTIDLLIEGLEKGER